MINNNLSCLNLLFWLTLFIGVLLPLPCQSTVGTTMHNNNQDSRTLQQQDNDDILYDPCSLCQGLPILFDKRVPTLDGSDYQPTCNEIDLYYRYNFTTPTITAATTCKNDYGYNYYFDKCCQPSIPKCK
jgi:hypothetical protein